MQHACKTCGDVKPEAAFSSRQLKRAKTNEGGSCTECINAEITSAEHREVRALCGFDAARMAMPPPPGASPQGTSSRRYIDLTPDSPKFAPLPFPKV